MKGIVGRKLGMTQVFDQETGVLTPVTVIEAGPCPVVAVRTVETDGYDAVQLAFDEVPERKLTKPELGHLAKHKVAPHRRLVELRGPSELATGETVTVEAFEPGEKVKVTGVSIGKGFQGTIKRHNFSRGPVTHGSHNVRKPGSIGASATPSRVFKGMKMAGRMGGEAGDPARAHRRRPRPRAEPAPRQGRRAGAQERVRRGAGGRPLVPIQVIQPSFCVASTKQESALGRGQCWLPWQGRGPALAPRDRGAEAGLYCLEGH